MPCKSLKKKSMYKGVTACTDIRIDFGQRIKELRTRAGMSQEILAHCADLDRSYISSIESGQRNISILNIGKIAAALKVSIHYLFSNERFSIAPAYQQQDFRIPFIDRFKYHLDCEKSILAFQVKGLICGKDDFNYLSSIILGVCTSFGKGRINVIMDYRFMVSADGQPAVFSPEGVDRIVIFQQKLINYCSKVVVLCNSDYMVQQLKHISIKGTMSFTYLFGRDEEIVACAYESLGIKCNHLIQVIK